MTALEQLPIPHLNARRFGARCVPALTDDALREACGIRIAFTGREGGVSEGPYASLNLGAHVDDDPAAVSRNRAILLDALGAPGAALLVPNQVHGSNVVYAGSPDPAALEAVQVEAAQGADAVVVNAPGVAALLCFADCVPVIVASPSGAFAVAHAGWRGVVARVAVKAALRLAQADGAQGSDQQRCALAGFNVYVGPHICPECFEVGADVADVFKREFGASCLREGRRVSLLGALRTSLCEAGASPERIADAKACTKCAPDVYYSYRATGGVCGRHGAVALQEAR